MSKDKKKKKDKKLKAGESYTRENRPKGVSKNEWDKARKAEGKSPNLKFYADPKKERKAKASGSSYGTGKKTYAELTGDEKKQADDFINNYKQTTFQNQQGGVMSMDPNVAKQKGYTNPFQGNPLGIPEQQQVQSVMPQKQLSAPAQKQADTFLGKIKNYFSQRSQAEIQRGKQVVQSNMDFLRAPLKEKPGLALKGVKQVRKGVGEFVSGVSEDELNNATSTINQKNAEITKKFLAGEISDDEYKKQSMQNLFKSPEAHQRTQGTVKAVVSFMGAGANMVEKEIAKSQSPELIKSILRGKLPDEAIEKAMPQLIKASTPQEVKAVVDTAKNFTTISEIVTGKKNITQQIDDYIANPPKVETPTKNPLIQESKPIYHGTPEKFSKFDTNRMEGGAAWFSADKGEILSGKAGAVQGAGQKLNVMERYVKPNVKLATREMEDKLTTDQLIQQGYRGVKYPAETAKGYESAEWTKLWFPNEDTVTKSQLSKVKSQPLQEGGDMVTVYHASPKMPTKGNWRKGTMFADTEQNARYYAESHHTGDITVKKVEIPKSLVEKNKSNNIYNLKEEYPVSPLQEGVTQKPPVGQSLPETIPPKTGTNLSAKSQSIPETATTPGGQAHTMTDKPTEDVPYSKVNDNNVIPPAKQKLPDLSSPEKKQVYKESLWSKFRTTIQDSWNKAKGLEKTGTKNKGLQPSEAQELFSGRVGARLEDLSEEVRKIDKDLVDTSKVVKRDLKPEVNRYLQAIHAPERNAVHGDGAAGMTTAEAKKIVAELGGNKEVTRIAGEIKKLNDRTLDVLLDGQVIDKATYDKLKSTYKNYVPLNRIMPEDDDIIQSLTGGKGLNVKGSGIKFAKGSDKEVADILTNTYANLGEAIARSEKNRVNLATLEFARNNKNTGLFEEISPKIVGKKIDFAGREIGQKLSDTPTTSEYVFEQITDPTVLKIREKGKQVYLKIHDEGLAKMYQAINQEQLPGHFKFIGAVTRYFASLATRFNPEFVLSNKIRDLQEAMVNVSATKGMGAKGSGKVLTKDVGSMMDVTAALSGADTPGARLYNQMRLDGGTTGGMALSTRKNLELDVAKIEKLNRSNPRKAIESVLNGIENWNTVFEDSTRLSVYKSALDRGLGREQAAILAKNATLNFNKKGTAGPIINSVWMFSNASIQGTTNTLKAMKNPKVAATVTTLVGSATYAANSWNDKADPEWRDKVSEWDRNSNLVIMLPSTDGGSNYITIPVAWGIKPIKVMSDRAYDLANGKGKGLVDAVGDTIGSAIDAYNPIGGTDMISTAMPTVFDTPVDLARNKSWSGSLIKPDWMEGLPKADQKFDSLEQSAVGRGLIKLTSYVSEKSKRSIDFSPQDLNYVLDQIIGGGGRFIEKTANSISGLVKGEEVRDRDIPFWSRFVKERTEQEVQSSVQRTQRNNIYEDFKQFETGSQEQKDAIQEYLKSLPTNEDRQREGFILRDNGFDMKGISLSESAINIKPTYEKVDELMKQGKVTEANQIIEGLSKDDRESFNRMRGNQKPEWYNKEETKAKTDALNQPEEKGQLYQKYQDLAKNNPAEAKKLLNSMDYQAMEMFKKERTAARAAHTRQVNAYLASDNPEEAPRFLDTLEPEEKRRIEGAMTGAKRERYLEGKLKYNEVKATETQKAKESQKTSFINKVLGIPTAQAYQENPEFGTSKEELSGIWDMLQGVDWKHDVDWDLVASELKRSFTPVYPNDDGKIEQRSGIFGKLKDIKDALLLPAHYREGMNLQERAKAIVYNIIGKKGGGMKYPTQDESKKLWPLFPSGGRGGLLEDVTDVAANYDNGDRQQMLEQVLDKYIKQDSPSDMFPPNKNEKLPMDRRLEMTAAMKAEANMEKYGTEDLTPEARTRLEELKKVWNSDEYKEFTKDSGFGVGEYEGQDFDPITAGKYADWVDDVPDFNSNVKSLPPVKMKSPKSEPDLENLKIKAIESMTDLSQEQKNFLSKVSIVSGDRYFSNGQVPPSQAEKYGRKADQPYFTTSYMVPGSDNFILDHPYMAFLKKDYASISAIQHELRHALPITDENRKKREGAGEEDWANGL